jgi:cytoskeletal protein CcmA (bactofilin family)
MWTLPDSSRFSAGASRMALAVLLVLGLLLAGGALPAQQPADPDAQALRATILKSYEVLPIRGGVLLQPRAPKAGVRSIEVSGRSVAVNGEPVVDNVLRDWIGTQQAAPILRLRTLDPDERRALFGLGAESAVPEPDPETDTDDDPGDDSEAAEIVTDVDVPEPTDPDVIVPAPPDAPEVPEPPADAGDAGDAGDTGDAEEDDAAKTRIGSQLRFGSGITVAEGEIAEDVAAFGGSVQIDGEVEHDVAAFGGSVEINGRVGGDVAAIGGTVHLGPNAEIQGDLSAVGGRIEQEPGAKVHGSISEAPSFAGGNWDWRHDPDVWMWTPFGASMELFGTLMGILVLALLVCLAILVARRPLEEADARLAAEPWTCALTGFAAALFSLPLLVVVTVLLVLTIVGCVLFLLYPFLALFAVLVLIFGYAVAAHRVGRWAEVRFNWTPGSAYRAALIGLALIEVWTVLGRLLAIGNGVLDVFAALVLLFGFMVKVAAWMVGLGAVLLAWAAGRPQRWRTAPAGGAGGAGGVAVVPPGTPLPPPPMPPAQDPFADPYPGGTPPITSPPTPPTAP